MAQLTQVSSKTWGYVNAMPPWGRKHLPGAGVGEVESVKGEERPAWHGQSAPSIPKSRLSPDFSEESVTHVTSIHSWLTVLLVTTAAFKRKCILQLCRQDLLGLKWGSLPAPQFTVNTPNVDSGRSAGGAGRSGSMIQDWRQASEHSRLSSARVRLSTFEQVAAPLRASVSPSLDKEEGLDLQGLHNDLRNWLKLTSLGVTQESWSL